MPTLYHYCTTQSFQAIVATRSVRLSSMNQSNDMTEGMLVGETLRRLAASDKVSPIELSHILSGLAQVEGSFVGVAFCLSADGDLLSQWRGYASDGRGVALGFDKDYLDALVRANQPRTEPGLRLAKVEYERLEHERVIRATCDEIRRRVVDGELAPPSGQPLMSRARGEPDHAFRAQALAARANVAAAALAFLDPLYLLKSPGFREEQEWRLVSHLVNHPDQSRDYRPTDDQLVPYRTYELAPLTGLQPIAEVVLGPKHRSPKAVVEEFLSRAGFTNAKIRRSDLSYR